jgi:hypothetical protein
MRTPSIKTLATCMFAALALIVAYTAGVASGRWLLSRASGEVDLARAELVRARLGTKIAQLAAQMSILTSSDGAPHERFTRLVERLVPRGLAHPGSALPIQDRTVEPPKAPLGWENGWENGLKRKTGQTY